MRILSVICLAVVALFVGCTSDRKTCDGRGESEVCEVHHVMMQTVNVPNPRLKTQPSDQYLQDRLHGFPHSRPFALPKECKEAVVYICEQCFRTEELWRHQHPEEKFQ
jgi:hypothetical protein